MTLPNSAQEDSNSRAASRDIVVEAAVLPEKDHGSRIRDYQRDWTRKPDTDTQNILDDLREFDRPVLSTETACG